MSSIKKEHERLYAELDKHTFRCIEGCTACCGPVPITPYEAKELGLVVTGRETKVQLTPTIQGTNKCAFAGPQPLDGCESCTVHDRRPFMCRLFGTVPQLKCLHGLKPKRLIHYHVERMLVRRYSALMKRKV